MIKGAFTLTAMCGSNEGSEVTRMTMTIGDATKLSRVYFYAYEHDVATPSENVDC